MVSATSTPFSANFLMPQMGCHPLGTYAQGQVNVWEKQTHQIGVIARTIFVADKDTTAKILRKDDRKLALTGFTTARFSKKWLWKQGPKKAVFKT